MFLSEFVIPKGTEVREVKPDECPTARDLFVVVNPADIPEFHKSPILRHDLTHRYVFVSGDVVRA